MPSARSTPTKNNEQFVDAVKPVLGVFIIYVENFFFFCLI